MEFTPLSLCLRKGFEALANCKILASVFIYPVWSLVLANSVLLGNLKDVLLLQGPKLRIGSCSAEMCRLATARQLLGTRKGKDVNEEGAVPGLPPEAGRSLTWFCSPCPRAVGLASIMEKQEAVF